MSHKQFVQDKVKNYFLNNPLFIKKGEPLTEEHKNTIIRVVMLYIDESPYYDSDFRHNWTIKDFVTCIC